MSLSVGVMADSYNKPSAGGGWTPASLGAALQYWFDASDASTITDAGAGAVSAWNDKSGNARHVTMATATYRPLTGTRTINGRNVIDFDGVNDALTGTAVDIPQPMTIAAVAHLDSLTSVGARIVGRGASQFNFGASGTVGSPPFNLQVSGGSGANVPGLWETTKAHVAVGLFNTTSTKARFDGVEYTPTGTVGTGGLGSNPFCIGSRGDGSVCWDGAIGEVVVTNTILTGTDLTNLEAYLTTKWITPAGFSPLSIPWHSAFWASDPSWIPPADGSPVSDWKNSGTAASNAVQATGANQPTYRAAYTNLNGKPAVQFDNTTAADFLRATTNSIAQPNHIFAVGWLDGTAPGNATLMDSPTAARHMVRVQFNNYVQLYAGTAATVTGPGGPGPLAIAVLFNQAASKLRYNGTNWTVPSTVGATDLDDLSIGSYDTAPGNGWKGAIAFLGVSDTELTAQQIIDLETWAKNYYGVPVAPQSPSDIPGLVAWYDADDVSTFTFSSGASVQKWRDKTTAKEMSAFTAEPQRTGTQNGRTSVVFDGTGSRMQTAAPVVTNVDNQTMIVACKRTSGNATTSVVFYHGNSGGSGYGIAMRSNGANIGILRGGVGWTSSSTADPAAAGVISICRNAGQLTMYLNGVATNININSPVNAPATFGLVFVSSAHLFGGEIYEALLYDVVLSSTDRVAIETYLKNKWGTP